MCLIIKQIAGFYVAYGDVLDIKKQGNEDEVKLLENTSCERLSDKSGFVFCAYSKKSTCFCRDIEFFNVGITTKKFRPLLLDEIDMDLIELENMKKQIKVVLDKLGLAKNATWKFIVDAEMDHHI